MTLRSAGRARAAAGLAAMLVTAALAAGAATPAAAVEPQKPYGELTPRPMWIEKVKDGLYVVRGPLGICIGPCVPGGLTPDGVLHEPGDVAVRVTPEGLILVDTKYEFGMIDGRVALVDEVHTPDSSRYWLVDTYDSKFEAGQEPDNFDKELLRLWMREQGFKGEGQPPALTDDIIARLSQRYQSSYERLTGKTFEVDFSRKPEDRIVHNLKQAGF